MPGRSWMIGTCWPARSPGSPRNWASGCDQPDAAMPALTGSRGVDWTAFAADYQRVTSRLHASAAQRQELAAATMNGMVTSLNDNHARWLYPQQPPGATPTDSYGLGITTSATTLAAAAPQEALPPLFVTSVDPRSRPRSAACGQATSSSQSTARPRSPTASSLPG